MRRILLILGVLVAAAAVAGCGGGSSLSSDQLHTQATQICSLASARTDRIGTPSQPAGSAVFLHRGIAVLGPELTRLRTLHPPGDLADVYSAALGSFSQKLNALQGAARDISRGADPVTAMKSLQKKLAPIESQENGGWQALGLAACLER